MFGIPGKKLLKISQNGECAEEDVEAALANVKVVLFYFTCHWYQLCRNFTNCLKEAYEKYSSVPRVLQIIYVPSENNQDNKNELGEGIPGSWVSAANDSELCQYLETAYNVHGLPKLVAVRRDGSIISLKARDEVKIKGEKYLEELCIHTS